MGPLIQAFIVFLVTCKNDEDPPKLKALECSQHFSYYKSMGIISDAQGQLTPQSPEAWWLYSLSVRKKEIQSKMEEQECSQDVPHYNPMGAFCCHGNQSSDPILSKTVCSLSPTPMMPQMKFDFIRPAGPRDVHVWKCKQTNWRQLESHPINSPPELSALES